MEGHDQKNFSGALRQIGAPPLLLWTGAPLPHLQIRSGATARGENYVILL